MSTPKLTVLESLRLAEQLLQEIKQHKTPNQPIKKTSAAWTERHF